MSPSYCPGDSRVYIDLGFYRDTLAGCTEPGDGLILSLQGTLGDGSGPVAERAREGAQRVDRVDGKGHALPSGDRLVGDLARPLELARAEQGLGEHELLATAFPKELGVQQGEVVENKRLSAVLDFIQKQQHERTEAKVAKPSTTLRKARLLRAGTPRRAGTGSSAETRP